MAAAFAVLAAAITSRPPKWLSDFDQSFYLTIAYDIDRHGVFSNGIFDKTDSTRAAPAPGMFFVPGYPLLVLAAMKIGFPLRQGGGVQRRGQSQQKKWE